MLESRQAYTSSSAPRTGEFRAPGSYTKDSKLNQEDLRTDYKRNNEDIQNKSDYRYSGSGYRKEYTDKKTEPRSRYDERRSASTERKAEDDYDSTLDKIEEEIKGVGQRLRAIHLQTIGKEPGKLEEERRQLRKRLIDLDYDHKMICAKKHIYGKDGPITSTFTLSPSSTSSRIRLAQIEAELALIRSRRLRDLEIDLLVWDYYLDWPYYSSYYLYRPYRYWRYYDRYLSYPYYSSLWWLL